MANSRKATSKNAGQLSKALFCQLRLTLSCEMACTSCRSAGQNQTSGRWLNTGKFSKRLANAGSWTCVGGNATLRQIVVMTTLLELWPQCKGYQLCQHRSTFSLSKTRQHLGSGLHGSQRWWVPGLWCPSSLPLLVAVEPVWRTTQPYIRSDQFGCLTHLSTVIHGSRQSSMRPVEFTSVGIRLQEHA